MNPTAIYSKSGKGVQEASGSTSHLKRADRAVLAAIDGRATVADVAQKVGKPLDAAFEQLITQLDKDGFIREISAGTAPAVAKPAAKAAAQSDTSGADLDFSAIPPAKPAAASGAKAQQSALNKAREDAEARAEKQRNRLKAETEAKIKAEMEAKLRSEMVKGQPQADPAAKQRAEAEAKVRAEAEAKIKAAREAAVRAATEAKAKADAEAKRVREEAEKAKREAEALKAKLEAEHKAREEAERKAKEEAERVRRELEEERRKLEEARKREDEERKQREEEARKRCEEEERTAEEERIARRKREEEEEQARRKQREEEEARYRKEQEERHKREEEERAQKKADEQKKAETAKPAAAASIADSLLADLDSFGKQEEEEQRLKEEADREAKAQAEAKAKADAERRQREEAEEKARAEAAQKAKEEAERKAKAEAEQRAREDEARRQREEQDRRAEEQRRRDKDRIKAQAAKPAVAAGAKADDDISLTDADLDLDDVRREQQMLATAAKAKPREEPAYVEPPHIAPRKRVKWGKPVAITLIVLVIGGLAAAHVIPQPTAGYERAATEALGRPVKIGSAKLWLLTGLQLRMQNITVGDTKIASAVAHPTFGSLTDQKKVFSRIDVDGISLPQEALAEAVFAQVKPGNFQVSRVVATKVELPGPLPLPKELQADIAFDAAGAVRSIDVRGADNFSAKLTAKDSAYDFEAGAATFVVPIAPQMTLTNFGAKGVATRQGLSIAGWDGQMLGGGLSGTANIRWQGNWTVDGVITARGINAAVFAPALVSEGKGEGTAKFTLNAPDPAKLASSGRFEGTFSISRGVLGSFDLSRVLQTNGREAAGRTPFNDMNGRAIYDRGAVALRDVTLSAGALNAGASADIAEGGALSGRIVADVRTASTTMRATLNLGGTVKEPRVRN